jgi:cardiolipin synthase
MQSRRAKSGSYTQHNRVQLVHGGAEYFRLMEDLIDAARHFIHLQVYIFDHDETGSKISEALKLAVQRGVKVYLLVDGYASRNLSRATIKTFRETGIRFSFFEPFFRSKGFYVGRRLHHKVFVVDAFHSLVAGVNISNRYNDILHYKAWLDWAVYSQGEISLRLHELCTRLWNASVFRIKCRPGNFPVPGVQEQSLVRMRRNDWVNRKTQVSRSYMELFSAAESHVLLMSSYFWPGRKLLKRMFAASARGVQVRLILAGISDVPLTKSAERYVYRKLFKNNIEVYEYQGNVLHGKIATADNNFVTIGSYNVNNLSAYASIELNLDIRDDDFATRVDTELSRVIEKDCIRVTEAGFIKKFNFLQRIWQRIAFDMVHVLFFLFTFYFSQTKLARKPKNRSA